MAWLLYVDIVCKDMGIIIILNAVYTYNTIIEAAQPYMHTQTVSWKVRPLYNMCYSYPHTNFVLCQSVNSNNCTSEGTEVILSEGLVQFDSNINTLKGSFTVRARVSNDR